MVPKFKSKQLAGLEWYEPLDTESVTAQKRHLEWLEGADGDSESAATTEKGLLAELFDDDDDDNESLKGKTDLGL